MGPASTATHSSLLHPGELGQKIGRCASFKSVGRATTPDSFRFVLPEITSLKELELFRGIQKLTNNLAVHPMQIGQLL